LDRLRKRRKSVVEETFVKTITTEERNFLESHTWSLNSHSSAPLSAHPTSSTPTLQTNCFKKRLSNGQQPNLSVSFAPLPIAKIEKEEESHQHLPPIRSMLHDLRLDSILTDIDSNIDENPLFSSKSIQNLISSTFIVPYQVQTKGLQHQAEPSKMAISSLLK